MGRAIQAVLLAVVSDVDTSARIAEVAALQATLVEGQATVARTAARSDFAAAADQLSADLEASGFLDVLSGFIETGQADVAALDDSVSGSAGLGWGWVAFLDSVEQILADDLA
jgi:hypothetical protein